MYIEEIYVFEVSPDLISKAAETVQDLVRKGRTKPLEPFCPMVCLDGLRVMIRLEEAVQNRCIHLAKGVNLKGKRKLSK